MFQVFEDHFFLLCRFYGMWPLLSDVGDRLCGCRALLHHVRRQHGAGPASPPLAVTDNPLQQTPLDVCSWGNGRWLIGHSCGCVVNGSTGSALTWVHELAAFWQLTRDSGPMFTSCLARASSTSWTNWSICAMVGGVKSGMAMCITTRPTQSQA